MTKTYYMFFIKKMYYNILDGQRLPFGDETFKYLYAYTDDKKLYKSFKKSRDIISSNNHVDIQTVDISMTDEEYLNITISKDYMQNYLSSYLDFNPFIFKKDIAVSLLKLGYAHYSMFVKYDEVSESWFKEKFYEKVILENPIEYDLLKIFLDKLGIIFTR